jgi:hypothetical protein
MSSFTKYPEGLEKEDLDSTVNFFSTGINLYQKIAQVTTINLFIKANCSYT